MHCFKYVKHIHRKQLNRQHYSLTECNSFSRIKSIMCSTLGYKYTVNYFCSVEYDGIKLH